MAVDCLNTRPGVKVASLTDVGCHRENNEDALLYWEPESDREFQRKGRLAIIADGMGGYEGGQEASRLAVETVREIYEKLHAAPQTALAESLAAAHQRIHSYALEHRELRGMGTTCTAIAIVGQQLVWAHVGDSRLYLVRGGAVSLLTRDHSYVGRLVDSGIVRSQDAQKHPQRHILTAALGASREVDADIPETPLTLEEGDILVLCTDGLWSVVGEQEIAETVKAEEPAEACTKLVSMALDRGGPDNITLQVLRVAA